MRTKMIELSLMGGILNMGILILLSIAQNFGIASNFLTPKSQSQSNEGGFWNAITIQVMRRPVISMVLAAGFLTFLGYFYFDLEKGQTGISALPDDQAVKIGFTLLDEKFGFGSNETANIAIDADIQSENIKNAINSLNPTMQEAARQQAGLNAAQMSYTDALNYAAKQGKGGSYQLDKLNLKLDDKVFFLKNIDENLKNALLSKL